MSYRAAVLGLERLGLKSHLTPTVYCDAPGCDARVEARTRSGGPPSWLLNGKPPGKGWRTIRHAETMTRTDYCPACAAQGAK